MINLIIGHRGTGKTHWLRIIEKIYKEKNQKIYCFDLDEELEKKTGKSINELFLESEKVFRDWEQKTFEIILKNINPKNEIYISVGAGFQFVKKPDWNVIFLTRSTDKEGRVFFDRPLLSQKSPLEDYKSFYLKRENYYFKQSDEIFYRPEHFKKEQFFDRLFLGLEKLPKDLFCLQLNPQYLPKETNQLKNFLNKRMNWGIRFFEIHDSMADQNFIQKIREIIPENKILFSSKFSRLFCDIPNKTNWSWDLSLGCPPNGVSILSLHQREKRELKQILKDFSSYKNYHLKLAIEILNMKELEEAYKWQQEDPDQRSFLPRSSNGRWRWFRNAFGSKMFLNFIREGKSIVLDQPFFSEAVHFKGNHKKLAGVLGSPIAHSATPSEHNDFFYKQRDIPVLPILLKEEEAIKENFKIFKDLGFVFFAITSPLKQKAFECADVMSKKLHDLKTVNTFILNKNKWHAYNTDEEGLKELKKIEAKKIAVWGGGGVKAPLKSLLPKASFYSARTGKPSKEKESFSPEIVIWAVGDHHMKQGCLFPPKKWQVHQVIDLNYMENSPGREYALKIKAKYQGGDFLFKRQAEKQREIFLKLEKQ